MVSARSSRPNCTGDRLTATVPGILPAAASRQAVRSAHSPISTMASVSSASGMNSAGEIMPRFGCRQRISASAPQIFPSASVVCKLVMQFEFAALGGQLQVARQRAAGAGGVVHLAVILADQAALLALAAVHRELGVAEHLVALRRVDREDREADRGGEA